ncbi:MAG: GNAT family N-acetyltransferase [Theionarchaea archaeon]|nr:GNAT family N-acetyltransferase [Theionarchaea archaeon]
MDSQIEVREASFKEITDIHNTIEEFDTYGSEHFAERCSGKKCLILSAHIDGAPAGYLVGYDRYEDGSFYCWMTGVNPEYREKGVLKAMMDCQERWAKKRGYSRIKIKTGNTFRSMLSYLVKYGFNVADIERYPDVSDNKILLEKNI